jgi:hypothetical protein
MKSFIVQILLVDDDDDALTFASGHSTFLPFTNPQEFFEVVTMSVEAERITDWTFSRAVGNVA